MFHISENAEVFSYVPYDDEDDDLELRPVLQDYGTFNFEWYFTDIVFYCKIMSGRKIKSFFFPILL